MSKKFSMIFRFLLTCLLLLTTFISITAQQGGADSVKIVNDNDPLKVFSKVEVEASYPGGEMAWRRFLERNLKPTVPVEHGAPAGIYTVWVQFVVDKEGNVLDIRPLTRWGFGMEPEVMRIIKVTKWLPASRNGRPVRAYRKQPVTFVIEEDGLEVHPEKDNCLYVGVDNSIIINATKAKDKNLRVLISQGTISGSDGKYIARVTSPGRALIEVYNRANKIGEVSLEVKPRPSQDER